MTVIFKGSDRCNAKCRFCAVGDPKGGMVTDDDFEILAQHLEELAAKKNLTHLEFNFHGGEPTLLGAPFLEKACERIRRIPADVTFSMQSNLLAVDPAVLALIRKYNIRVGTSVDPLHTGRLDAQGNDAYPTWLRNYLAISKEIDPPGAIFVVTRDALGRAKSLLDAAVEISAAISRPFGLQINPIYPQGNARKEEEQLITPDEFGNFLIDMWNCWEAAGRPIKLTPIQQFATLMDEQMVKEKSLSCSFVGECAASHVGIDWHLNVAGCGRRLDEGAFFGNLRAKSLSLILDESEERRIIRRRSAALRSGDGPCRDCRFFHLCCGGCPDDAHVSGGDISQRFQWCAAYLALFQTMEKKSINKNAGKTIFIHAVIDPEEAFESALSSNLKEVWVLPTDDGSNLRFEKGLSRLSELENTRIRIFVHNRHVPFLSLWERFLAQPLVSVVLFENEGIDPAVNLLNSMAAHITIDSSSMLGPGNDDNILGRLLDRFLFEKEWQSRIYPFSHLLMREIKGGLLRPANSFGLPPCPLEIVVSRTLETADAAGRNIVARLAGEARSENDWFASRSSCSRCDLFESCGGVFTRGDKETCESRAKDIVKRIREVAKDIRSQLHLP